MCQHQPRMERPSGALLAVEVPRQGSTDHARSHSTTHILQTEFQALESKELDSKALEMGFGIQGRSTVQTPPRISQTGLLPFLLPATLATLVHDTMHSDCTQTLHPRPSRNDFQWRTVWLGLPHTSPAAKTPQFMALLHDARRYQTSFTRHPSG